MADDLDATMAEIVAARAVLAPQIRGMAIMLGDATVSADMKAEVGQAHAARMRRDDLCVAALSALHALKSDGYPALPIVPLQNSLLSEMAEENSDLSAAVAIFGQQPTIGISPTPTFTPQPAPSASGP